MSNSFSRKLLSRRSFLKAGAVVAGSGLLVATLGYALTHPEKAVMPPTTKASSSTQPSGTSAQTTDTSSLPTSVLQDGMLPNGWIPNSVVPLAFGPPVSCGIPGDEETGQVYMPLYGSGQLKMLFQLPEQQDAIQVAICAWQYGSPTHPLILSLYSKDISTGLATTQIQPSGVAPAGSVPNWTSFATLRPASALKNGYYYLIASSPDSTSTSGYYVYFNIGGKNWIDFSATALFQSPAANSGNSGFSTIWIKDSTGNDLIIYPFGIVGDVSSVGVNTKFVPVSDYAINVLAPWQSDDHFIFGNYAAGYELDDITAGQSLGVAPFSQQHNSHGIQGLVPYQLPNKVNLVAGHTYQISILQSGVVAMNDILGTLIRGSQVNPAQATGVGFPMYWWGEIANTDFSHYRILDYAGSHYSGGDGFGSTRNGPNGLTKNALRFVPNYDETLTSVSLKMKAAVGTTTVMSEPASYYHSGVAVTLSIYSSDELTPWPSPTGPALASATVDSGTIPLDGWFTVRGLDYQLQANKAYFLMWSAPNATEEYDFQRDVSPYRFVVRISYDGGKSWTNASQGPTEMTWKAVCSKETIGNPFDDGTNLPVTSTSALVAQPFILSKQITINSIFSMVTGGVVKLMIYPDNGSGTGPDISAAPLTSGSFNTLYNYFYSGCIIPLAPTKLQAGTKYWIVYSSFSTSNVTIAYYWTRPTDPNVQQGYEVRVSNDGGSSWSQPVLPSGVGVEPSTALFLIGALP